MSHRKKKAVRMPENLPVGEGGRGLGGVDAMGVSAGAVEWI
jgi:hypothetical protein